MLKERADRTKLQFESLVKQGKRVTFDSSAILPLAEAYQSFVLGNVISHPLFEVTPTVFRELQGLQKSHHGLVPVVKKIALLGKIGKPNVEDVRRHELLYQVLIPLLPRKIAHELMVTDEDSYVSKGIRIFNEGLVLISKKVPLGKVIDQVSMKRAALRKEVELVSSLGVKRLMARVSEMDVDWEGFDFAKYKKVVDTEVFRIDQEIQQVLRAGGADVAKLSAALEQFKRKTYAADVRHMAEVFALKLENITDDSDQLFLLEFHSRAA